VIATLLLAGFSAAETPSPAAPPRTLRLEYVHAGDAGGETFALRRLVREGPWPGPLDRGVDETNLGRYLFEVRDRAANRLLVQWRTADGSLECFECFDRQGAHNLRGRPAASNKEYLDSPVKTVRSGHSPSRGR
jgi:hypothetical protein